MTVWYFISTIFNRRYALRNAGLIALCVALITTLFFANVHASVNTNRTISFQGRLLRSGGGVVPDGSYNIQFKIYEGGSGDEANNPGGELKWTEDHLNDNADTGIKVKNGYFSVNLGSATPFGSSVDWNHETLWLSMNIAGSANECSEFDSESCEADGEMLPMKQITATPYSINSGAVGGKTINQLVQLGQGVQIDPSDLSGIFINKTGSGNLMQLQAGSSDSFIINHTGSLTLGSSVDQSISLAPATSGKGKSLTLAAGAAAIGSSQSGGDLILQGGDGDGESAGGKVIVKANSPDSTGTFQVQNSNGESILSVDTGSGSVAVGSISLESSAETDSISSEKGLAITSSDNLSIGSSGGDLSLQGESIDIRGQNSGNVSIQGGDASTNDTDGGSIVLSGGKGSGAGSDGLVVISTPTFQTETNDANCFNGGVLASTSCTISSSTVNSSAAVTVGFDTIDQVASLPDPNIKTAGRIFYVMAAPDSEDFTLSLNEGGTEVSMSANSAAHFIWSGSDWLTTNSPSLNLQGAQDPLGEDIEKQGITLGNVSEEDTEIEVKASTNPDDDFEGMVTGDTPLSIDDISTPITGDDDAPLGSMYYDTSAGKLQCYEADGWGNCGDRPDTFITISPEYSGAVMNGADIGTITSDLCSDALNINNGTDDQPAICGDNETYNFYQWTSEEEETQTRSIFVNYQLPANFDKFVDQTTSLTGRTDSADSSVDYQIYRDSEEGLETCGPAIKISEGATSWQKTTAEGEADPANCDFKPGDSILFRINLSASNSANAYVSNLSFVFSSN